MSRLNSKRASVALACAVLLGAWAADGATVLKMDLEELCDRASQIFRGTVVSVEEGTVSAGGAELPTVTYTLKVDEAFKGEYTVEKGVKVARITMLGSLKPATVGNGIERYSFLPQAPDLQVGSDYLLMTSAPSAIGLSATIGLGQGCFHVYRDGKDEMAVNELGNVGLFDGPVSYSTLAGLISGSQDQ